MVKKDPIEFLLIMAMRDEARPLIQKLSLTQKGFLHSAFDMVVYEGFFLNNPLKLVLNGVCKQYGVDHIGTQVSTLSAHLAIELFKPSIIINAGTAGGFTTNNAKVGDVYLSAPCICYHDRRINLPNFKEYGVGFYPTLPCGQMAKDLGLKTGVVSTGNSLDYTTEDLNMIQGYNGVVKDMEGAAIAWIAQQHKIPFLAIKALTDIVGGEKPTEEEFLLNLHSTSETLGVQTVKVIEWLSEHGI